MCLPARLAPRVRVEHGANKVFYSYQTSKDDNIILKVVIKRTWDCVKWGQTERITTSVNERGGGHG